MTAPRVALIGFTAGASMALGVMGAFAARSAYAIHKAHHWADVRRLLGIQ